MTRAPSTRAKRSAERRPRRRGPKNLRTLDQAQAYLLGCPNFERVRQDRIDADAFKLDRMRAVLEVLDDPHTRFRSVHIAGSKGK